MKNVEDLTTSARTMHDRYASGRMDREIVRQWVMGLSVYPEPYGRHIQEATAWFKPSRDDMDPVELKIADLARLQAIYRP
ncbi:hypothetical protein J2T08_004249 [Neorhizobium galegae]|uniref:hypothetical protein n=1 Tax=Neorhizobium galegae TaxID=399 RepID=UPI001AEAB726|nr:hypothetical protein [Neorhizobium galegae]MBP2557727.1 hypothetical protein [Neorhizobium galegae]MDQ0136313.1 hypothetical protein [Neorhizobium galegae]